MPGTTRTACTTYHTCMFSPNLHIVLCVCVCTRARPRVDADIPKMNSMKRLSKVVSDSIQKNGLVSARKPRYCHVNACLQCRYVLSHAALIYVCARTCACATVCRNTCDWLAACLPVLSVFFTAVAPIHANISGGQARDWEGKRIVVIIVIGRPSRKYPKCRQLTWSKPTLYSNRILSAFFAPSKRKNVRLLLR